MQKLTKNANKMYRKYLADPMAMSAVGSLRRRASLDFNSWVSPVGFLPLLKDAAVLR